MGYSLIQPVKEKAASLQGFWANDAWVAFLGFPGEKKDLIGREEANQRNDLEAGWRDNNVVHEKKKTKSLDEERRLAI